LAVSPRPTLPVTSRLNPRQDGEGGEEDTNFDPGYEPDWAVISTVKRAREPIPAKDTGEGVCHMTRLFNAMIYRSKGCVAIVQLILILILLNWTLM